TLCTDRPTRFECPVGWWKFDEGSGTLASDSSRNGNVGTLVNGPRWVAGKHGGALDFDGVDDFVDIGNPPDLHSTGARTLAAWVNVRTLTNGRIVAKAWSVQCESGNVFEFAVAGAPFVDSTAAPRLGDWMHVAGVFEPSAAMRIYVDGAL